jgi:sarcosine oxidase subunit gamma
MSDPVLRPESVSRRAPRVPSCEWLQPLPPAARFVFHGNSRARAAAAGCWGVPFAEDACRAITVAARSTLMLGPEEYLLLGPAAEPEYAAAAAMEEALRDIPHALVDVSHRQVAIEVAGANAAVILNAACPLDLDLLVFPVGMCTRTVLAKADIVLWRTRADAFHLEIWRSFSEYVTGLLSEAAREFTAG